MGGNYSSIIHIAILVQLGGFCTSRMGDIFPMKIRAQFEMRGLTAEYTDNCTVNGKDSMEVMLGSKQKFNFRYIFRASLQRKCRKLKQNNKKYNE